MEHGVVVARWPLTPTVLVQFRLLLPKNPESISFQDFSFVPISTTSFAVDY